jgi:shikimate dehydrogenase
VKRNLILTNTTDIYAVLGDPIGHSLSPLIFNTAFEILNLNCLYLAFRVKKGEVKNALTAAKQFGLKGLSITMPLKEEITSYLNLSDTARKLKSVNVVSLENMFGTSTDGEGFCQWFKSEIGSAPKDFKFLIFGTGGAARAVGYALFKENAKVYFYGRDLEKVNQCYLLIESKMPQELSLSDLLKEIDFFINATPIGMANTSYQNESPLKESQLTKGFSIIDLIYHPLITPLGKMAKQKNIDFYNGVGMLVYQAKVAFEIFFNQSFPTDAVSQAITDHLNGLRI